MKARALLLVAGVGLAALYLAALVDAVPPARVHVAVIAEPVVDPAAPPYVVRLSAVDVAHQRPVHATGVALLGDAQAPFDGGVARVPPRAEASELSLVLDVEGRRSLTLTCPVRGGGRARPQPLFVPREQARVSVTGVRARTVALTLDGRSVHADITAPAPDALAVELLVDGALRDVVMADVAGATRVTFALPADVRDGAIVVVHAAEPWPLARGAFAAATLGGGPLPLEREQPAQLRPAPLACAEAPPRFAHLWRTLFEASAAVFVIALVVGLGWRSRAEPRRAALLAVVAGLVMSACLIGLDLVLRLGAAGAP